MQPRDRQEMLQAGLAERLLDLFGDRTPLAGDQRRGDAAGRARQYGGYPPRHLGAQLQQGFAPATGFGKPRRGGFRTGEPMGVAVGVADAANPSEIGLPLKVVSTR